MKGSIINMATALLMATMLSTPTNSANAASDYVVETMETSIVGVGFNMNASGMIAGLGYGVDSYIAAVWDSNGNYVEVFPGLYFESSAYDINDLGQVAATSNYFGFGIWQNGNFTALNIPGLAGLPGLVRINNAGTIASTDYVYFNGSFYERHAFTISNNTITDLGALPGATESWAYEINNNGDVVGYSFTPDKYPRAVLWKNGTIINLGTLPGQTSSYAYAINDKGRVVGSSGNKMFSWENGVMTDLGSISANASMRPFAINNNGDIVGTFSVPGSASHAFLWRQGVFTDLTENYNIGETASSINDNGQILVSSFTSLFGGVFRLTPTTAATDLAVSTAVSATTVTVGQSYSYTLTVRNVGSLGASNVIVTDTLPAEVSFVSASSSQGSCSGTSVVSCNLGAVASGAQATIQITVTPTVTGYPRNYVSVSTSEAENNTINNSVTNTVQVVAPAADVSVSMSASAKTIKRNSNLTYTITVQNNGPASASSVKLTDILPSGMSFVSATSTQGSCSGTSTVTCNVGTMANGASATVKITVQARNTGFYSNTAVVTSGATDSNLGNNTVSVTTTVK